MGLLAGDVPITAVRNGGYRQTRGKQEAIKVRRRPEPGQEALGSSTACSSAAPLSVIVVPFRGPRGRTASPRVIKTSTRGPIVLSDNPLAAAISTILRRRGWASLSARRMHRSD